LLILKSIDEEVMHSIQIEKFGITYSFQSHYSIDCERRVIV